VEDVGLTEVGVEVVVLTEEAVVVELPWVVTDMDHLQQSEVAWYHHRVDQWPREVDLKEHKVLMAILLTLIHRGQSLIASKISIGRLFEVFVVPFFLLHE
jgi:hypothetical protein